MRFRMNRTLRFWVEAECDSQDLKSAPQEEVATILRAFERADYAMRHLDRRGRLAWKATPYFKALLRDAEEDVKAEWRNERD